MESLVASPTPLPKAKTILLSPKLKAENQPRYEEKSIREALYLFASKAESNLIDTGRRHVKNKTPVLGSDEVQVRTSSDWGFFSTIFNAYNNHWSVRTCVEDWWYTIIQKVAMAIDSNSKSKTVRDFFVSHEGKKEITVAVGPSVYGVNYSWFLDQMTNQIAKNIKVENYVDILTANYSTSSNIHRIVSQITVMASVQEYFEFRMQTLCGIPSLEMEGEESDWKMMKIKFLQLKSILEPIHKEIGLEKKWWDNVEQICDRLIKTFNGKPDKDWWSHIFSFKEPWGSGEDPEYNGWFISKLLGLGTISDLSKVNSGVVTVPMTIVDITGTIEEESAFAAGICGFLILKEEGKKKCPSVKACHGWTLMLQPDSIFREELAGWESKLGGA